MKTSTTDRIEDSEFLKATQAVAFQNISRRTFERMKKDGLIPYIRYGKMIRYRKSDLLKVMEKLTVRG